MTTEELEKLLSEQPVARQNADPVRSEQPGEFREFRVGEGL